MFAAEKHDIHTLAAMGIAGVTIGPGQDHAVQIDVQLTSDVGLFQVEETLGKKAAGTLLRPHVKLVAHAAAQTGPSTFAQAEYHGAGFHLHPHVGTALHVASGD